MGGMIIMRKKLMCCMLALLLVIAVVVPEVKAKGLADSGWIGTRCAYTLYLWNANQSDLYGTMYLHLSFRLRCKLGAGIPIIPGTALVQIHSSI